MSRLRRKMFILLFIFIIFVSMFIMAAFLNSPGTYAVKGYTGKYNSRFCFRKGMDRYQRN